MLKGFDENGNVKDVLVTEDGAIKVAMEESGGEVQQTVVANTSENPVPVDLQNQSILIGNTNTNAVPVNVQSSNPIPVNVQNPNMLIGNTLANPVPVNVTNAEGEVEITLNASVQNIGTTATTIAINKKITSIDIANYSETSNITVTVGNLQAVIGSNIATTLTINANVENISLSATEANTKAQIIVKGVN